MSKPINSSDAAVSKKLYRDIVTSIFAFNQFSSKMLQLFETTTDYISTITTLWKGKANFDPAYGMDDYKMLGFGIISPCLQHHSWRREMIHSCGGAHTLVNICFDRISANIAQKTPAYSTLGSDLTLMLSDSANSDSPIMMVLVFSPRTVGIMNRVLLHLCSASSTKEINTEILWRILTQSLGILGMISGGLARVMEIIQSDYLAILTKVAITYENHMKLEFSHVLCSGIQEAMPPYLLHPSFRSAVTKSFRKVDLTGLPKRLPPASPFSQRLRRFAQLAISWKGVWEEYQTKNMSYFMCGNPDVRPVTRRNSVISILTTLEQCENVEIGASKDFSRCSGCLLPRYCSK